jgi:Carboxypeptidase regulatory-like domain
MLRIDYFIVKGRSKMGSDMARAKQVWESKGERDAWLPVQRGTMSFLWAYRIRFAAILIAFAFASIGTPLWAQLGTGSIAGSVTDSSQALVRAADVVITNVNTGEAFSYKTNDSGLYSSIPLIPGTYTVSVSSGGFKTEIRQNVLVEVGSRTQVNVVMSVGSAGMQEVNVTSTTPDLNTSNSTLGTVVAEKPIADLPTNGRMVFAFAALTPGVRDVQGSDFQGINDRGDSVSQVSINGAPAGASQFVIDGINNTVVQSAEATINPSVEGIREFKVESGSMAVTYGYTAGGAINVVTKSGTNQYHGNVYEFLRNDIFDAKNYFALATQQKPKFRYNQYGASFGGKIIRNKLFVFGNFEKYNYIRGVPTYLTVPSTDERNGNYSNYRTSAGVLIPIYDPNTTIANPNGSGFVRAQFPGNIINPGRLDPVAVNYQNLLYPMPNVATPGDPSHSNNYYTNVTTRSNMWQAMTRIDGTFSQKDSIFGRLYLYHFDTNNPNVFGPIASRTDSMFNKSLAIGETHVFTASLINELRFGFTRNYFTFTPGSWNKNIPESIGFPSIVPPTAIPIMSNGLAAVNDTGGVRARFNLEIIDNATKVVKSHTITVGTDLRYNFGAQTLNTAPSGNYVFASTLTGNPQTQSGTGSIYASFLLGQVSSATVMTVLGEADRAIAAAVYGQDDWKATPNLTLNAGVRWDYQQQPFEQNNGYSSFNPNIINPLNGLKGSYQFAKVGGLGRNFVNENYHDIGPRLGFAYNFGPHHALVARGGYALYYALAFGQNFWGSTTGFQNTTSYSAPNSNFEAFPLQIGLPSAPIQPLGAALGPSAFLGQGVTTVPAVSPTPNAQQITASVQTLLPFGLTFESAYVYNHGSHFTLPLNDINQIDPSNYALGTALQNNVPNPYFGIVPASTSLGGSTITKLQSLKPYPYYSSINTYYQHVGYYKANLAEFSLSKRPSHGFSFQLAYTIGKDISSLIYLNTAVAVPGVTSFQNPRDLNSETALDPTDVSQRATIIAQYELPFGRGKHFSSSNGFVNGLIGGWQINNITILQGGYPVQISGANNNLATRPNFATGVSPKSSKPKQKAGPWFNQLAFVNPPSYTYGNVPRSLANVRSPGTINFNDSIFKDTHLGERLVLQLRAEAFNLFNRTNLGRPNGTFSPGTGAGATANNLTTFGYITSTQTDNRDLQFAAKLSF